MSPLGGAETPPVAVVTGAATGIGLAIARSLAAAGWRVVATRMPGQRIDGETPPHFDVEVDLTDRGAPDVVAAAASEAGGAGLFVSAAGISLPGPIELRADDLDKEFAVNAVAPARLASALLPQLRRHAGRIVLIGAGQGRVALPFGGGYAASKAGLAAIADALRAEVAADSVSVSLIEPGAVRTGILESSRQAADALMSRASAEQRRRYEPRLTRTLDTAARSFETAPNASQIADLVMRVAGARRPRPRYSIGREAHALTVISHLPARWRASIIDRIGR